ncbi:fasciclin domain-containing protein [Rhizobiales bacterium]|uniref:fasciclin domain-containing protein n=1 Tax=Hongsoonwoonella zoysiae TaxID=2821844 RepID=UPI001561AD4D|nr:fasciclin domain-containing protein [Hongsoonwoonella zoysiae]NRG16475.1 fasciclin domain-containing protein [Hongsoonwoonella zoysiae]
MRKLLLASAFALATTTAAHSANIVETAKGAGTFNTLLAAAQAAGLADALATTDGLTVFAPTDEAFAALPEGTVENLLKPENKDQLVAILSYHVVPQKIMSGQISDGSAEVATLKGSGDMTITVEKTASGVTVDGANVVTADVEADNGVIHVIDKVILPSD